MKYTKLSGLIAACALGSVFSAAQAVTVAPTGMKITEWMYNGLATTPTSGIGEFIEFTNFGPTSINLTGWSFDDNSRVPGSESLSAFGSIASGESVIFTDQTAALFRSNWGLSASVKVIGGNTDNLGRSDEINLYDASNVLVDRLTYNDQGTGTVAGPRTAGTSARANSIATLGANNASLWTLSVVGDADASYKSALNEIGSPGKTSFAVAAVPLPGALFLLLSGLGVFPFFGRRKVSALPTINAA